MTKAEMIEKIKLELKAETKTVVIETPAYAIVFKNLGDGTYSETIHHYTTKGPK